MSSPQELLRFLCRLGHVLLATGEAVSVIEATLQRVGRAHGAHKVSVVAFPTALFVKLDDGEVRIDFTGEEGLVLRFDQMEAVAGLALEAEQAAFDPGSGLQRIDRILAQPPQFGAFWIVLGHVLMTLGIALVMRLSVTMLGAAAFFGLVVGLLKLLARGGGMLNTLLPTIAAFSVGSLALYAVLQGYPASPL
ncbi:MAG: threonine/serine exporter family protein, partial [Variovorax sp.]